MANKFVQGLGGALIAVGLWGGVKAVGQIEQIQADVSQEEQAKVAQMDPREYRNDYQIRINTNYLTTQRATKPIALLASNMGVAGSGILFVAEGMRREDEENSEGRRNNSNRQRMQPGLLTGGDSSRNSGEFRGRDTDF